MSATGNTPQNRSLPARPDLYFYLVLKIGITEEVDLRVSCFSADQKLQDCGVAAKKQDSSAFRAHQISTSPALFRGQNGVETFVNRIGRKQSVYFKQPGLVSNGKSNRLIDQLVKRQLNRQRLLLGAHSPSKALHTSSYKSQLQPHR